MRYLLTLLTTALLAAPALAQENDAEKLYRAMEKKIRSAQTLRLTFDGEATGGGQKLTLKGTALVAEGNKGRIEAEFASAGKSTKLLFISDGKTKYMKEGDMVKTEAAESKDSAKPLAMIARVGFLPSLLFGKAEGKDKEAFDIDKEAPVKNFKLGVKDKLGKRQAQVVEFEITFGPGASGRAAVWIDTETELPLKRTLTVEGKGKEDSFQVVETFATFTINPKLDGKAFDIPK